MWKGLVASALACFLLAGCATSQHIARRSVDYNEAVEWNTNVVMLMNAVRASKRIPVHYTRLGSMVYNGNVSAGSSFTYTFGNDTPEDAPLSLTLGASDGGNVNFENQSSEEFYKAILASISPETVAFYRDQGWPDEVVLLLFIERIDIEMSERIVKCLPENFPVKQDYLKSNDEKREDENGTEECTPDEAMSLVASLGTEAQNAEGGGGGDAEEPKLLFTYDNAPDNPDNFISFITLYSYIRQNYAFDLEEDKKEPFEDCAGGRSSTHSAEKCKRLEGYFKLFGFEQAKDVDLSFISEDASKKYHIEGGDVFAQHKRGSKLKFTPLPPKQSNGPADGADNPTMKEGKGTGQETIPGIPRADLKNIETVVLNESCFDANGSNGCKFSVTLRSPHAAVYYLGELIRAQNNKNIKKRYEALCSSYGSTEKDLILTVDATELCTTADQLKASNQKGCEGTPTTCKYALFHLQSERDRALELSAFNHRKGLFVFPFQGDRYWVSKDPYIRGRTLQMVSLLNEIFAQKQKASIAPSVTILEGIGN